MITRRGWAVLSGSIAMAGAARTFGVLELFALAAGGVGLVVVALVSVLARRRVGLEGTRRLVPQRVHAGADSRVELIVGSGDEFYALRAYEVGDDLRRVHWPSTARRDDLMIRQHEMPWQGRATVLLDVRQGAHTEQSLEQAVSATASLLTASWQRDSQ